MSKKLLWAGSFLAFLLLAGMVALGAKQFLPKVSAQTLSVQDCNFSSGRLELDKNQTVKLTVSSDRDGIFTIDNYNISEKIQADQPEDIIFKAVRSGAYEAMLSGCEGHTAVLVRNDDGNLPSVESQYETSDTEQDQSGTDAPSQPPGQDQTDNLTDTVTPNSGNTGNHSDGEAH